MSNDGGPHGNAGGVLVSYVSVTKPEPTEQPVAVGMKRCPFCGSQNLEPVRVTVQLCWCIECFGCGARGPLGGSVTDTPELATERWDERV